jgi:hypothetical protein
LLKNREARHQDSLDSCLANLQQQPTTSPSSHPPAPEEICGYMSPDSCLANLEQRQQGMDQMCMYASVDSCLHWLTDPRSWGVRIIDAQFSAVGNGLWFIPGTSGASFLRREAEDLPFMRLVYLPNSYLVSNRWQMHFTPDGILVTDEYQTSAKELTDEEFARGEI